MASEISTLRIKAERLGTVEEVKHFLSDLENAYNDIYAFDFLVETLSSERQRRIKLLDEQFNSWRKFLNSFVMRKEFPYDPQFFEFLMDKYILGQYEIPPNILERQNKLVVDKIILPSERLQITKVNIQSPGFWEFLGAWNPLQQIREYIKDRHERKKDKKYRSRQEEELGDLSIMEKKNNILGQRIQILRELGYSEVDIRQLVLSMVVEPLDKLGEHQDKGQIGGLWREE